MPEKDNVQPEQEEKKELTVDDLETIAGGEAAEEEFGTKIDEAGDVKGIET